MSADVWQCVASSLIGGVVAVLIWQVVTTEVKRVRK